MVDGNADEEINEQQINLKLELGQKALDEKKFDKAKENFTSIYVKTNKYKQMEIIDGIVRSLTNDLNEVNQEQECFRYINELYSLAKGEGKDDICDRCDQYFEFCKNKKEEIIYENKLRVVKQSLSELNGDLKKLKTKDDLEIEKIKKEIQNVDNTRIENRNKQNKVIFTSFIGTLLCAIMLVISTYLMSIGSLIEKKNILYIADGILIFVLIVVHILKIKKANNVNKEYLVKINRKKSVIKEIESRTSNLDEMKQLNEKKIEILNILEEKEKENENIEEQLNSILVKINAYENMDKGKVINL